jgi:hypothetical protein
MELRHIGDEKCDPSFASCIVFCSFKVIVLRQGFQDFVKHSACCQCVFQGEEQLAKGHSCSSVLIV